VGVVAGDVEAAVDEGPGGEAHGHARMPRLRAITACAGELHAEPRLVWRNSRIADPLSRLPTPVS
jgi:hypothetical protein